MNTAILLSGGIGSRMRSDVPKQYIPIGGRMLITYALTALAEFPLLDQILIVAEESWRKDILRDAEKNSFAGQIMGFAPPGFNRQAPIISGMQEILWRAARTARGTDEPELQSVASDGVGRMVLSCLSEDDTVLIHDAARPLLTAKQIADCFDALAGHDGVMPVLPMKDTVYLSRDGETVSELLDRKRLFAGQAPELFRFKKYYQANMALTPERLAAINGSTEPAIMAGMDVVMIPGDENNFKVTTKQDLERFRSIVRFGKS